MNGHRSLMAARMSGRKPAAVFLIDLDGRWLTPYTGAEMCARNGAFPEIEIEPDDVLGTLDLRAVRGLRVLVLGADKFRVAELMKRAAQFQPAEILGSGFQDNLIARWTEAGYQKLEVTL